MRICFTKSWRACIDRLMGYPAKMDSCNAYDRKIDLEGPMDRRGFKHGKHLRRRSICPCSQVRPSIPIYYTSPAKSCSELEFAGCQGATTSQFRKLSSSKSSSNRGNLLSSTSEIYGRSCSLIRRSSSAGTSPSFVKAFWSRESGKSPCSLQCC